MGGIYWLASYPKSGNTWFRTFLQNLRGESDAPVDINELSTGGIASGRRWLDEVLGFDTAELEPDEVDRLRPIVYRWSATHDETMYVKIHDACWLLPDGEPIVSRAATRGALYLVRNPLDVVLSYANHNRSGVDEAIACMADAKHALSRSRNRLASQTRQMMFDWSGHVRSWVDADGFPVHVVRYEDMLADTVATFTAAAAFLALPTDPARIEKAIRFSAFDELKRQEQDKGFGERPPGVVSFFRQGRSGDWRGRLDQAQVAQVIADHGAMMRRFGYLDADGAPV